MPADLHSTGNRQHNSHHLDLGELLYQVGRGLLVIFLFISFFLLAHSMVHHRFFKGGRYHQNGSLGQ